MFILLPTDKQGLASLIRLEEKLTVEKLEHMFSRMEAKTVAISLPKFRIQQKLQLKVNTIDFQYELNRPKINK
jgi:serine protease inhibitor